MDLDREQKLIQAAQRGNDQAFAELYDAHVDAIYRYMLYRVENSEVARDLTSEVFLRVVEGFSEYQSRDIPFRAWLYRIAHARTIDYYRRSKSNSRHADNIEDLNLKSEEDVEDSVAAKFEQQLVLEALGILTPDQQQVLLLRFIESYNVQETATILGKSISAVKVLQHRAIQALGRELRRRGTIEDVD